MYTLESETYWKTKSLLGKPTFHQASRENKIIIQGFGSVGQVAAENLARRGAVIVGIITSEYAIYDSEGINIEKALQWVAETGSIREFEAARQVRTPENPNIIMEEECDILIPAAYERSIHRFNAPNIKCKVVAEAANGPTTVRGEEICEQKGIKFIPDLILNSGGVIGSYFEWLQNLQHVSQGRLTRRWEHQSKRRLYEAITGKKLNKEELKSKNLSGAQEIDIVFSGLEDSIHSSLEEHLEKSLTLNTTIRIASLASSLNKIGDHYKHSGLVF